MKTLVFKSKLWPCAVAGAVLLLSSTASWAACTRAQNIATLTINVPSSLNIPRDTPIGAEVYRSDPISLAAVSAFTCNNGSSLGYQSTGGTASSGPSPLGNSGLGWRLLEGDDILPPNSGGQRLVSGRTYYAGPNASIRLYKMGNVSTLSANTLGSYLAGGTIIFSVAMSNDITPVVLSCETPSVNVPLGRQSSSDFKGVGSTVGERAFNIQLNNCPAGLSSISYQFDPVNSAFDATKGILALDEGGATGVGIQITDSSSAAVILGEAHNFLSNVPAGNYAIPLKAAYYQTSDTVGGGTANASMQFTITYQ